LTSRYCLEKAVKRLEEHKADVLLARLRFPDTPLARYLSKAFPDRLATRWGDYTPCNSFMLARKSSLIDVGLYDENFAEGAEDVDLLYRMHLMNKRVVYDPEIEVFHNAGYSINEWINKAYRDGFSIAKFDIKHKIKRRLMLAPIYPILASFYAFLCTRSLEMLYGNFILAKERRRGYLDALKQHRRGKSIR